MNKKILIICLSTLSNFCVYAANIFEVKTASNNVLVVVLEAPPGEEKLIPNLSGWKINGAAPNEIGRYSYVRDEEEVKVLANWVNYYPITTHHHIYLVLPKNLMNDSTYAITSPYGNINYKFNDKITFCESIKVNQVGYAPLSTDKYANFGIFLGNLGSKQLATLPAFAIVDSATNTNVLTGTLSYWGKDTALSGSSSGEFVYRIDLSALPEGGPYYISISGIGRSYSFGVGNKYLQEIAKVHSRGMYHQRCGIALEEPFTHYTRGVCHEEVAFVKNIWDADWVDVPANASTHKVIGGYHDAGDYDRRPMHTIIPILLLNFYDAFPEHFVDAQYNIPESGNGLPDFLDEALWATLLWENLQLDSSNTNDPSEYGGVMQGTDNGSDAGYGIDRADFDDKRGSYGTYEVADYVTLQAAGIFAQASRLVKPYDPVHAAALLNRAVLAWNYCKNKGYNSPKSYLMYAALQLYLASASGNAQIDAQNKYHLQYIQLANELIVNGGNWPDQYYGGNPAAKIKASHFASYLFTKFNTDATLKSNLIATLKTSADEGGYMAWNPAIYPYAQGATKFIGWGALSAQGLYAEAPCYMYKLSVSSVDRQKYYNLASNFANDALGLNPLGKSFTTGLGKDQPQSTCHLDSWWTKYGKVPGIVTYGPMESRSKIDYQAVVSDKVYPTWDKQAGQMPGQRRWSDGWSLISVNEFTTWETNVWNTCMWGFLYDVSKDPNYVKPNICPSIHITSPTVHAIVKSGTKFTITTDASDIDGKITNVSFYNGTTLLGSTIDAPFNYTFNAIPTANYSITAVASDNSACKTTSTVVPFTANNVNVKITSPANNSTYFPGSSVILKATATDTGDTISSVSFYNGSTLLGTVYNAPYNYTITSAKGFYSITAVVTDNLNSQTTSSTVYLSPEALPIPGIIQTENWNSMYGIKTAPTNDVSGGLTCGWIDPNDYMEYYVNVLSSGTYKVEFRIASTSSSGQLQILAGNNVLCTTALPNTNSWSNWTTTSNNLSLSAGIQKLKLLVLANGWDINWMKFTSDISTAVEDEENSENDKHEIAVYPNPLSNNLLELELSGYESQENVSIEISDMHGKILYANEYETNADGGNKIEINTNAIYNAGMYIVSAKTTKKIKHIRITKL